MGIEHGAWCLGCCWILMGLLFFGGVMNLLWIAAIAIFVLLEKAAPSGDLGGRLAGAALVLELARVLALQDRPYTIWIAFVEGDAGADALANQEAERPFTGSDALAGELGRRGMLERVRMAVFFGRWSREPTIGMEI